MTTYELWDKDSGNALGEYTTEADALADVRETVRIYGRAAVADWLLARVTPRDRIRPVAEGNDLAERATPTRVLDQQGAA